MSTVVREYLEDVRHNLKLEASDENEVISELSTHIEDEIQELQKRGWREEDAARICVRLLGSAKLIARQFYESHSQETWQHALLGCLPHILFSLIFLLNRWSGIGPVLGVLIAVLGISVYGWWWHGRSRWLFPWLGYSLLPVIAAALLLLYLPRALAWIAVVVYVPLAIWLVVKILTQTIKRDWVYISLMLLPMPVITGWFLAARIQRDLGGYGGYTMERLHYFGPGVGLSFMALALAVVAFARIRRRWLKIAVLFMTGAITVVLLCFYAWGKLETVPFLLLMLLLGSIFFIPAVLASGARSGRWGRVFENRPMQSTASEFPQGEKATGRPRTYRGGRV